jgi:hypothetical protein
MWPTNQPLKIIRASSLGVLIGSFTLALKYKVMSQTPNNKTHMDLESSVIFGLLGVDFMIKSYLISSGLTLFKRSGPRDNSVK